MFNTRQRAQLALAGITGHEGFGGAAPAEWLGLADAAVGKKQANGQAVQPLDTKTTDVVINYCSAAINKEIEAIAAAEVGEQERAINNGGLAIHSLLSGARVRGVDAHALRCDLGDEHEPAVGELRDTIPSARRGSRARARNRD
jgi:hypothetical protein